MFTKPDSALVIVGHGSTVNPNSSTPTFEHADAIRNRGCFGEVVCAFWKEEPGLHQVRYMVGSDDVYIVPNFISEGYFTQKVLPRELDLDDAITHRGGRILKYCEPVGNHPRMTELLLRRAREVAPDVPPAESSLLIIGHGTSLNENSGVAVKEQVRRIAVAGGFAEVFGVFMEEEPFVTDWRQMASQPNIVAVPFFVSDGLHSYQEIPVLLGIEKTQTGASINPDVFRRNPYHIDGRRVFYASAIGTESLFADLILEQVTQFDQKHSAKAPRRKPPPRARRDMNTQIRSWLDDGLDCIGEIRIGHSEARFTLSHRADPPGSALEEFTQPNDAREIAKFDEAGKFRPLKSAPTLRRGWRLTLRDISELGLALDFFYPAMAGTFAAHRSGGINPVDFRATASRQSGMYAAVKKISDASADRVIGTYCASRGGCLKTILWKIGGSGPITTQPPAKFEPAADQTGNGEKIIPLLCSEACHLLVAAVREAVRKNA